MYDPDGVAVPAPYTQKYPALQFKEDTVGSVVPAGQYFPGGQGAHSLTSERFVSFENVPAGHCTLLSVPETPIGQ